MCYQFVPNLGTNLRKLTRKFTKIFLYYFFMLLIALYQPITIISAPDTRQNSHILHFLIMRCTIRLEIPNSSLSCFCVALSCNFK